MKRLTKRERNLALLLELRKVINTRPSRRPDWFRAEFGLCWNFGTLCILRHGVKFDLFTQFKKQIKSWPLWTGDNCFIVPGRKGIAPGIEYDNLYPNKYTRKAYAGRNRRALLDHLIQELSCPSAA